ncbi:aspartate kinase [Thermoflavifilum thermophilum]|uniref:Aspartokinase n=1 Tax=Thermoflavifilum thermophilum TaxID=1393122 RepID=A0A1I7NJA9_9BACT|nr:aspartate kinase [Thermoflavifilum thermophilum]SFV34666.1 aspartate kinase [Thermoflavifilum thermophilum]
MKIMKFGGTSVGKPERMHAVARLILAEPEDKIVVLSALSGTTNTLVQISKALAEGHRDQAKQIIDDLRKHYDAFCEGLLQTAEARVKARDIVNHHFEFLEIILKISFSEALERDILAQGELLSTQLFCTYLEEIHVPVVLLPALEFMYIDEYHEPVLNKIKSKLSALLAQYPNQHLFVTQGYICRNARGEVDNLKRGGSDYTASLIGAAVNASEIQIWTDIDGMHNNDPRVVKNTFPIEQLSFDEAAELAYFGAKILHPASIWPAQYFNIPVRLLNTMQPEAKGTLITDQAAGEGVKAVAAKDGITAIKIKSSRMLLAYGFLRKVFEVFEKYRTPIDMITTSEVAVSLTIDQIVHLENIQRELEAYGSVEVEHDQTIIAIVGNEIVSQKAILKNMFSALEPIPLRMISYGGSRHNVSLLINSSYKEQALRALNKGLFGLD